MSHFRGPDLRRPPRAPSQPTLREPRCRRRLLFPGRAELRPGETPVAADRAVAPRPRARGGRALRPRVGLGGRPRAPGAGAGARRLPGWARRRQSAAACLERGPRTRRPRGRLSFGKTLAIPPPMSMDLAAALDPAADLCPPVTPAFPARKGSPTPAGASSSRAEPGAPGSRQAPGSPGPRPGRLPLLTPFRAQRVPALPALGLEGKPRTKRSPPCPVWVCAGWGSGSGARQAPRPAVAPAASP